jgi:parallel beta-helix repeat protein
MADEVQAMLPGARAILLNALAQTDVDMAHHKLLNLDTSNLALGGPHTFNAVPHQWLNSYSATTLNFSATQPATPDLSDWPAITGQSGKFLTNNGTSLSWQIPTYVGGVINVKNTGLATGNAVGDGVTDDTAAIQGAINFAGQVGPSGVGGITVYFPAGVYLVKHGLTPARDANNNFLPMSLVGDNPFESIIRVDPSAPELAVLTIATASVIQHLGFDGGLSRFDSTKPVSPQLNRSGIQVLRAAEVFVINCFTAYCGRVGIAANSCYGLTVRDCIVSTCGTYGILLSNSPRSLIFGNTVTATVKSGIWLINSPYASVQANQVYSCAPYGYGIGATDSDNTTISGNNVAQNLVGIFTMTTPQRMSIPQQSFGYTITGNVVMRNYYAGIQLRQSNGFQVTGNTVTDNGQGGTDGATYTVEPGIVPDPASAGINYAIGDVLTLSGGTFVTPAKVLVTSTFTRGGNSGVISPDGLAIITMGSYTVFPANSVTVIGGSGTGAKVILTGTLIASAGTNYTSGMVLVATGGTFYNAVRVIITAVDVNGGVKAYQVLDGGGYTVTVSPLSFQPDGFASEDGDSSVPPSDSGPVPPSPPPGPTASGFQLTPSWGLRYSLVYQNQTSFNIGTYLNTFGGVIQGNVIDTCKTGCGILNEGDGSGYLHRAVFLTITGNSVINNHTGQTIKGKTLGGSLDDDYNPSVPGYPAHPSVIASNLFYPDQPNPPYP